MKFNLAIVTFHNKIEINLAQTFKFGANSAIILN